MSDQWYYRLNGKQFGPTTFARLHELLEMGVIKPDDEVREEGDSEWVQCETVPGLEGVKTHSSCTEAITSTDDSFPSERTVPKEENGLAAEQGQEPSASSLNDGLQMFKPVLDFFAFRTMIVPHLISAIFFVGCLLLIYLGVSAINDRNGNVRDFGMLLLVAGPLLLRIVCEYLVVQFRINNTLTEMKNEMERSSRK